MVDYLLFSIAFAIILAVMATTFYSLVLREAIKILCTKYKRQTTLSLRLKIKELEGRINKLEKQING